MENKIESLELEEMRQQMATLRQQLEEQVLVNDELVVKQLKKNTRSFNNLGTLTLIVGIVGIYPAYVYCHMYGVSMVCFLTMVVGLIADGCYSYYVSHIVQERDYQKCSFSEIVSKLLRMKKLMKKGEPIEYSSLLIFAAWLFYETVFGPKFAYFSTFTQTKVIIGFTLGLALGVYFVVKEMRKRYRQIDEMIRTLSEK